MQTTANKLHILLQMLKRLPSGNAAYDSIIVSWTNKLHVIKSPTRSVAALTFAPSLTSARAPSMSPSKAASHSLWIITNHHHNYFLLSYFIFNIFYSIALCNVVEFGSFQTLVNILIWMRNMCRNLHFRKVKCTEKWYHEKCLF